MSDELAERRGLETDVYQPAEDSTLLLSVASEEVTGTDRVLDLGTGSGFVGEKLRETTGATVIGSDINPHACRQAAARELPVVRTDGTKAFRTGSFDVVVFNPPYLPANPAAARDDWMEAALTGGTEGRDVIAAVLDDVTRVLTRNGTLLLVVSSLTGIDAVQAMADDVGLSGSVVSEESFPFETLVVLRFVRRPQGARTDRDQHTE